MNVWMRSGLKGLEPVDEAGSDLLRRIKQQDVVRVEITKPRNGRFHRKFFALLTLVWSASGEWTTVEDLLLELKVRLGLVEEVVIRGTGEIVKIPGSISFANMDELEFGVFFESAMRELCEMAGGIEYETLRNEVLNQVAAA